MAVLLDGNLSLFLSGQIGSVSLGKEQVSLKELSRVEKRGKRECVCVLGQGGREMNEDWESQ